jgi:hypothetical protein
VYSYCQDLVECGGVDLGMEAVAHLTAAKDRHGKFSGYYKCSLCGAEFRPNSKCLAEMWETFAAHVQFSHPQKETKDDSLTRRMYRKRV